MCLAVCVVELTAPLVTDVVAVADEEAVAAAARGVDGDSKNFHHTSHETNAKPKMLQQRTVVSLSIILRGRVAWRCWPARCY